eukprot:1151461-Pelagomonas_calceolata.AAC.3
MIHAFKHISVGTPNAQHLKLPSAKALPVDNMESVEAYFSQILKLTDNEKSKGRSRGRSGCAKALVSEQEADPLDDASQEWAHFSPSLLHSFLHLQSDVNAFKDSLTTPRPASEHIKLLRNLADKLHSVQQKAYHERIRHGLLHHFFGVMLFLFVNLMPILLRMQTNASILLMLPFGARGFQTPSISPGYGAY